MVRDSRAPPARPAICPRPSRAFTKYSFDACHCLRATARWPASADDARIVFRHLLRPRRSWGVVKLSKIAADGQAAGFSEFLSRSPESRGRGSSPCTYLSKRIEQFLRNSDGRPVCVPSILVQLQTRESISYRDRMSGKWRLHGSLSKRILFRFVCSYLVLYCIAGRWPR